MRIIKTRTERGRPGTEANNLVNMCYVHWEYVLYTLANLNIHLCEYKLQVQK